MPDILAASFGNGAIVAELRIGSSKPFGPRGRPSAINKSPISGRAWLSKTGLEGDEQGDLKHHGGPEKALHQYCSGHYRDWSKELPNTSSLMNPGAFGENIVSSDADETTVCIGDIFKIGTAIVQVSQGRQPCWKLNVRVKQENMAHLVQKSGRTGWYYRVLEEGRISAGDTITLMKRPNPDWCLSRIHHTLYVDTLNKNELAQISKLTELSNSWRTLAEKRLRRLQVEDWSTRLNSPK